MTERQYPMSRVFLRRARCLGGVQLSMLALTIYWTVGSWWITVPECIFLGSMIWVFWRWLPTRGARETAEGLVVYEESCFRVVTPWDEIIGFRRGPKKLCSDMAVIADLRGGGSRHIVGLHSREPVSWEGGHTDDIVAELNGRLDGWQRQAGVGRGR